MATEATETPAGKAPGIDDATLADVDTALGPPAEGEQLVKEYVQKSGE